ncbi:hypothetical protein E2C01_089896 [Portunus trituberculatus]|uniref:Uncharacterized protein n=1 Tax=Portunus trituberculatus TaxID=210409 RepID=A0A5B7JJH3_PORTR|nr:hypothetical protein [Portunus trituberculatus]
MYDSYFSLHPMSLPHPSHLSSHKHKRTIFSASPSLPHTSSFALHPVPFRTPTPSPPHTHPPSTPSLSHGDVNTGLRLNKGRVEVGVSSKSDIMRCCVTASSVWFFTTMPSTLVFPINSPQDGQCMEEGRKEAEAASSNQ